MSSACHLTVFKALNFARASVRQSLSSCGTIAYLSNCSLRQIHMEGSKKNDSRGALIVLEGLDRCGKTSQCSRLLSYLEKSGHAVESWRFPDRNTGIGQMISSYLANDSHLDDHAIHLLFSANRWEKRSLMESKLRSGTTLIVDRYSYSGVAFSSAKGLDVEWCKAPEVGLLAPDLVVYLEISPEVVFSYLELNAVASNQFVSDIQSKLLKEEVMEVRDMRSSSFRNEWLNHTRHYVMPHGRAMPALEAKPIVTYVTLGYGIIDATLPIEDIEKQVRQIVEECVLTCEKGKPFSKLWLN